MKRFSTLFPLACALATIGAAPTPAFAAGAYYEAELAAPAPAERLVTRDLVWKCSLNGCVAGRSNSLARTDCAALARRAGALRSFSVAGRAISAADLEKCNARAR